MFKGIAASPGIEIGKAYLLKEEQVIIDKAGVQDEKIELEIKRLENAVETSKIQLKKVKEKAEKELGKAEAQIFEAHLMFLEDPVFMDEIKSKIKSEKITAEHAVLQVAEMYLETFNNMED